MGPNTVFGHLAFQFATHPENLATEALSFVLRTSPAASRAFTEFLRPIGLDWTKQRSCPSVATN